MNVSLTEMATLLSNIQVLVRGEIQVRVRNFGVMLGSASQEAMPGEASAEEMTAKNILDAMH